MNDERYILSVDAQPNVKIDYKYMNAMYTPKCKLHVPVRYSYVYKQTKWGFNEPK